MPEVVSEKVLKRRAAVERCKTSHREYYLQQKRELSARPEYRAHIRAKYHRKQGELREAGILPRKLGRPRLYEGEEAIERNRQRAREAVARYRDKIRQAILSLSTENVKVEETSEA